MTMTALTGEEQAKLRNLEATSNQIQGQIKDLKESLRDKVKAFATELEIEPKVLNSALKLSFKEYLAAGSIDNEKAIQEDVVELLEIMRTAR